MTNPFDEINSKLDKLLKLQRNQAAPQGESVGLFRFMSLKEATEKVGISKPTLYAHMKAGHITFYKFGNRTFIDRSELEKVFKKVERKSDLKVA